MNNIFFDFDGTLLESRPRLYQLFQHMVPQSTLSFEEYWNYKRNKISHSDILKQFFSYSPDAILSFQNEWLAQIEQDIWIALDKPFEGVFKFLKELKQTYNLFLVTSRQSERVALNQVENVGLANIFNEVLVTGQTQDKHTLIVNKVKTSANDWIVGDTGYDVLTGKKLGIKTAVVLTGFLSKEKLVEYQPDIIADKVTNLTFN